MHIPKLVVIELNEINFSIVKEYIKYDKHKFSNLKKIIDEFEFIETYSEQEDKLLEPWIQWTSAHTNKEYKEHEIYRLGDSSNNSFKHNQIFEQLEKNGEYVGAISPMNSINRMSNPSYFIPDAWTQTISDNSKFSKKITKMLRQTINDNTSKKIDTASLFTIIEIFFRTFHIRKTVSLVILILKALINPWLRSLVLDNIIHLIHLHYIKKNKPTVTFCFFNAGAHIQHHYMLNSPFVEKINNNPEWYIKNKHDPMEDMLRFYDNIIQDYLNLLGDKGKIIISTGLSQKPYDRVKFYYRIKNHKNFLKKLNINFVNVYPRMTRDFEITFKNQDDQNDAIKKLAFVKMKKNSLEIFGEIESRNKSIFVTLNYPNEIKKNDIVIFRDTQLVNFYDDISFVAIKNGMHSSKGYIYMSKKINYPSMNKSIHIKELYNIILAAAAN